MKGGDFSRTYNFIKRYVFVETLRQQGERLAIQLDFSNYGTYSPETENYHAAV